MITVQMLIVLAVLSVYVPLGRFGRIGKEARTLATTNYDKGSSALAGFAYVSSLMVILAGAVLTYRRIACFDRGWVSWIGAGMTLLGFLVRLLALSALGRFYTRTIRIMDHHEIVMTGLYRYIRHPGYLGVLMIFLGSALAIANWISLIYVCLVMPAALAYRIHAEETMMMAHFGDAYRAYMKNTGPLIPPWRRREKRKPPKPMSGGKPGAISGKGH